MQSPNFHSLLQDELRYFDSADQRTAFLALAVTPFAATQRWSYGSEVHTCFVVARGTSEQIVYCATGFGPAFPWSVQSVETADLGTDGQWCAYLYECFVSSTLWPHPPPIGFVLCGPNERTEA
jgi:hypothetical protein